MLWVPTPSSVAPAVGCSTLCCRAGDVQARKAVRLWALQPPKQGQWVMRSRDLNPLQLYFQKDLSNCLVSHSTNCPSSSRWCS